ncbi:hypothetical protein SAMN06265218_11350 [Fodinibius sediminis]|uniref:Uncharacterized protein n=1 Tax=Fodinibius sediminis TaxID=1214077 RepID=A0A521E4G2_9BACT|nr:hypothetical protein SAMN06265218_11350 [Fodinibius sediminis]
MSGPSESPAGRIAGQRCCDIPAITYLEPGTGAWSEKPGMFFGKWDSPETMICIDYFDLYEKDIFNVGYYAFELLQGQIFFGGT